jgi:hypothetical protein
MEHSMPNIDTAIRGNGRGDVDEVVRRYVYTPESPRSRRARAEELFDDDTFDRRHAQSSADPILAMIAEADRLAQLTIPLEERADKLWFALIRGEEAVAGDGNTALALYREVEALRAQQAECVDRIECTKATTLAGVMAQLQFLLFDCEYRDIIVAGLRDLDRDLTRDV